MRYFAILWVMGFVAACAPQTAMLKHPITGDIVQCGPSKTLLEETQCLNKYQDKGYIRYTPKNEQAIEIRKID